MKKTYFLLKDISNGEPYEMLAFEGICDMNAIQDEIDRLNEEFCEKDKENTGWVDYQCQGEYVLNNLCDKFPFKIIPWNNEDNLYF